MAVLSVARQPLCQQRNSACGRRAAVVVTAFGFKGNTTTQRLVDPSANVPGRPPAQAESGLSVPLIAGGVAALGAVAFVAKKLRQRWGKELALTGAACVAVAFVHLQHVVASRDSQLPGVRPSCLLQV